MDVCRCANGKLGPLCGHFWARDTPHCCFAIGKRSSRCQITANWDKKSFLPGKFEIFFFFLFSIFFFQGATAYTSEDLARLETGHSRRRDLGSKRHLPICHLQCAPNASRSGSSAFRCFVCFVLDTPGHQQGSVWLFAHIKYSLLRLLLLCVAPCVGCVCVNGMSLINIQKPYTHRRYSIFNWGKLN